MLWAWTKLSYNTPFKDKTSANLEIVKICKTIHVVIDKLSIMSIGDGGHRIIILDYSIHFDRYSEWDNLC